MFGARLELFGRDTLITFVALFYGFTWDLKFELEEGTMIMPHIKIHHVKSIAAEQSTGKHDLK